jgi:hypothetical protein
MKRCPSCQRVYADDTLRFCLEDGAPLVENTQPPPSLDSAPTLVAPSSIDIQPAPGSYRPGSSDARTEQMPWRAPQTGSAYGTPTVPLFSGQQPAPPQGRRYLGWIVGGVVLVFLAGVLLVGGFVVWSMIKPDTNSASTKPGSKTTKDVVVAKLGGGDYTSISEAIRRAPAGARINVRPGIYNESLVLNRNVEIVGDGPITQIVIEVSGDNSISMETDTALVRGLTLRNRSAGKDDKHFAVIIKQGQLTLEDCDISSGTLTGVGVYGAGSRPVIRRCRIHDCVEAGIFFYQSGKGTVEDCDIYNNGFSNISIIEAADPTIRDSRIYNGKASGVHVYENGKGTIEDCSIYGNAYSGVAINEGGDPYVNRCKINRNGFNAVYSYKGGKGSVENSDLTGNKQGAWDIDNTSNVRASNNTE